MGFEAPQFDNHGTRWKREEIITSRSLCRQGKIPGYSLHRKLGGPQCDLVSTENRTTVCGLSSANHIRFDISFLCTFRIAKWLFLDLLRCKTLYAVESTLHVVESALYAVESTLYAVESTLYAVESALYAVETTLYAVESTFHVVESTFHVVESALYAVESTLYAVESTLYAVESLSALRL